MQDADMGHLLVEDYFSNAELKPLRRTSSGMITIAGKVLYGNSLISFYLM